MLLDIRSLLPAHGQRIQMSLPPYYLWNQPDTEQYFDTPDDALEYIVAGDRLRDIITQIDVLSRAF